MKRATQFLIIFALLTILAAAAFSQDKGNLTPMPDDLSLPEAGDWFVKNLNKNFGYGTIDDSVKISDLKYDGCRISYRSIQKYTDQKAALGDKPALGDTGAVAAKEVRYTVYEDVAFDLKNIDPKAVGLGPLATPKSMSLISLETVDKKDLISFNRKGTSVRYNASGKRSTLLLPVKQPSGVSLAKGLQKLVQRCQEESAK